MNARRVFASSTCYQHEFEETGEQVPRLRIKRVYLAVGPGDGRRVLVDRLWPRGVSRARAQVDDWMPQVAPTPALRRWFDHEPARWAEFRRRYRAELRASPQALSALRERVRSGPVTLVYAARDVRFNHAAVLLEILQGS